jgi:hypothetical protein
LKPGAFHALWVSWIQLVHSPHHGEHVFARVRVVRDVAELVHLGVAVQVYPFVKANFETRKSHFRFQGLKPNQGAFKLWVI